MTFSTFLYILYICFSPILLAEPLQAVNDHTLQSDVGDLRQPSSILSTFNATLSSSNVSVTNELSIECDGEKYGFKPDVDDCTSAIGHQKLSREQIKFGDRSSSSRDWVNLPYRLMGGMWFSDRPLAILCDDVSS